MKDDQEWCMDVFDHFVLAGQSATVGEAVVRRYRPVSADNDHIVLHIFSSDKDDCKVLFITAITGKSLSEALIFASTNPQYDNRLFTELQVTLKFQAQNMERTCCVQKLFLTFRTIFVQNMFSPCSA